MAGGLASLDAAMKMLAARAGTMADEVDRASEAVARGRYPEYGDDMIRGTERTPTPGETEPEPPLIVPPRIFTAGGRKRWEARERTEPTPGELTPEDFFDSMGSAGKRLRKLLEGFGIGGVGPGGEQAGIDALGMVKRYEELARKLADPKTNDQLRYYIKQSMQTMEMTFNRFFGPALGQIQQMLRLLQEFRRAFPEGGATDYGTASGAAGPARPTAPPSRGSLSLPILRASGGLR